MRQYFNAVVLSLSCAAAFAASGNAIVLIPGQWDPSGPIVPYSSPPTISGGQANFNATPPSPIGCNVPTGGGGFNASRDFSFTTTGDFTPGGSVTISYTVNDSFTNVPSGSNYRTSTYEDGFFSVPVNSPTASLESFINQTSLIDAAGQTVANTLSTATVSGQPIDAALPEYKDAGVSPSTFPLTTGDYTLHGALTVAMKFPNGNGFARSPEPGGMVLGGLCFVGVVGYGCWRRRRPTVAI
jgi:hypothetical protein